MKCLRIYAKNDHIRSVKYRKQLRDHKKMIKIRAKYFRILERKSREVREMERELLSDPTSLLFQMRVKRLKERLQDNYLDFDYNVSSPCSSPQLDGNQYNLAEIGMLGPLVWRINYHGKVSELFLRRRKTELRFSDEKCLFKFGGPSDSSRNNISQRPWIQAQLEMRLARIRNNNNNPPVISSDAAPKPSYVSRFESWKRGHYLTPERSKRFTFPESSSVICYCCEKLSNPGEIVKYDFKTFLCYRCHDAAEELEWSDSE